MTLDEELELQKQQRKDRRIYLQEHPEENKNIRRFKRKTNRRLYSLIDKYPFSKETLEQMNNMFTSEYQEHVRYELIKFSFQLAMMVCVRPVQALIHIINFIEKNR